MSYLHSSAGELVTSVLTKVDHHKWDSLGTAVGAFFYI